MNLKMGDMILEEYGGENYIRKNETKTEKSIHMQVALKEAGIKSIKYLSQYSENCAKQLREINNNTDKLEFSSPFFIGQLKPYQIEGVNWLINLHENGMSGILGDEMGLGKTIQTIALFAYLYEKKNLKGTNLIVCPLSTLPHWQNEFKRFAPTLPVIIYNGNKKQRQSMEEKLMKTYKFNGKPVEPIIITPYHIATFDKRVITRLSWNYIIVDEGQRIKNCNSTLNQVVTYCTSINRLLLTGTPIQNNLNELWSLLHFLMPKLFKNRYALSSLIYADDLNNKSKIISEEKENNVISSIHKTLEPFMLRRLKDDVLETYIPKKEVLVYCRISPLQKTLYKYTVDKRKKINEGFNEWEIDTTLRRQDRKCRGQIKRYANFFKPETQHQVVNVVQVDKEEDSLRLTSFYKEIDNKIGCAYIQLKKIVDHPYLLHYPDEYFGLQSWEHLMKQSGKLVVLDALLTKLFKGKHKVLLYSTLTMMMDIIEEYLEYKGYLYKRLDGTTRLADRITAIDEFNQDPDIFIFILSTRAGGLGINLAAADTVIFYDRDWNPQVDIQAQDRCHRIGQTKPVMIFTLVTKNTIDEIILNRGKNKKLLEKILISKNNFTNGKRKVDEDEINITEKLTEMLEQDDVCEVHSNGLLYSERELRKLLDRNDLIRQMTKNNK